MHSLKRIKCLIWKESRNINHITAPKKGLYKLKWMGLFKMYAGCHGIGWGKHRMKGYMTSTISWWFVSSWKITTLVVNTHNYKSNGFSCTFHENSKTAGGGASLVFSHTLVHPTVLGEHFGDHQSVGTAVVFVTEVLTIIDLFSTLVPFDLRRA